MHDGKSIGKIPDWLLQSSGESSNGIENRSRAKTHFLRRTLKNIAGVLENELYCEKYAAKDSFLQIIDPRVKLCIFLAFLVFGGMAGKLAVLTVLAAVPIVYAGLSGLAVKDFFRRIWLVVPLAVFIVSLPGTSSLLIRGRPLFYLLPPGGLGLKEGLYFSAGGLGTAFRLMLRTGISLSFAFLLFLTTKWSKITAGLASMHLPPLVVSILNMAYRYLFLLAEIAQGMMEARYLRTTGKLKLSDNRHFMAHSAAYLFVEGHFVSEEVYEAMCCRGYTGNAVGLSASRIGQKDFIFLTMNAVILFLLIAGEHLK
ncbi:MAG: cobalt ECF transporter T component CbiQ [Oscillospiraceae bacterium]|jgi:cobalt ECF transporter T component CbiQ|nr:cobalt ECF transporter T component CbiQ [Oscillospiraceae bacterium]MCI1991389.1 cobalt ECF transporter T component CbiQ [Oscillospiraceae bacterium]MCI2036365.1 cobalt ECF transporter T component CbiQ [Oscillospiraceae bacterium]